MSTSTLTPPAAAIVAIERKVDPDTGKLPSPAIVQDVSPRPAGTRHQQRRWIWVTLAALAIAAVVGVESWRSAHAVTPVHYVTSPVSRGSVTRAVTASGSVNPVITIQVGSYVSGVIQELYCDYNTVVRKGQLCAKIDPRPYQVVVDQDRATLSTAKAQLTKDQTSLALAKVTYDRTVDLRTRGVVSQDTLDSVKSSLDQATAQVDLDNSTITLHQATLNAAEINLAYTNILSPVDGTVVSRSITMGQTVAASFQTPTLFLIATDLTKMQVDANVNEGDIGDIVEGNRATFTVETFPNRLFEGQVTQVRQAPQTVQNVVTYDVVVSVENPELLLKPGMTATIRIVTDRRDNVLRVPDHALRYTPGGIAAHGREGTPDASPRVWVLRNDHPMEVPVAIGLNDDTFAEVTKGALTQGDEVITSEETNRATTGGRVPFFRL